MVCNLNAVGQKEDALKLQQRLLSTFVIVQDDSSDESESNADSLDHIDIDSLSQI
jgi:hypothetical protein